MNYICGTLFGLALLLLVSACTKPEANTTSPKRARVSFPVEVAAVNVRDVTYSVHAVGSVHPFENISLISRVSGRVTAIHFQAGDAIDTKTVLVEIEPERYRLAVSSAEANLAKANALLAEATSALQRRVTANRDNPGLIAEEEVQLTQARLETMKSDVALAQSALAVAQLDLKDALVTSPLAGVLQNRLVQTGAFVQVGTVLATLQRREPLLVNFRVPTDDAMRMMLGQAIQFTVDDSGNNYDAVIKYIAAGADPKTRLIDVTAHVNNAAQKALFPGSFARITIPLKTTTSMVVPLSAIRPSERGFLAFVIQEKENEQRAQERVLKLGMRTADGQVEVHSGLAIGERLVIRGTSALSDGVTVLLSSPTVSTPTAPTTSQAK
jgi:membrane fusion protein, multidrug efflux system